MSDDLSLAADFPPATREAWRKLVDGVLKGAAFDKLLTRTYDDLLIEPLYARATAARPVVGRAPGTPWQVMQRVDHPDPRAANAEALHDLGNGATGLSLVFAGSIGACGFGIEATEAALNQVLDGVYLDGAALELDLSPQTKDAAQIVASIVKDRGMAPSAADIRFGCDPIGAMAASGAGVLSWPDIAPIFARLVRDLVAQGFAGPFAVADARVIHAAGGSEAQELGYALAVAVAYLRALEAGGMPLADASRAIFFRPAADADQFLTIAKFRALRLLWKKVEEECGIDPSRAFVSAETAWRMMTKRDPWVNLLRGTVAAFSAGLGGADAVIVLPFSAALGLPDRFARRLARNTQLILLEEANIFRVSDPAAGSGGIEDLTEKLCAAAWRFFQDIESAGGAAAALEQGIIQERVAATRAKREAAVAMRREALTGTSEFADLNEVPVSVLNVAPLPPSDDTSTASFAAMSPIRLAQPFERLREASDRILAASGTRPRVFLANLGAPSDFTARAAFAKNFFEAGGIEAVQSSSTKDVARDFQASGARLACLCSSDETYAREAGAAAQALKDAGAAHIYLAGRPRDTAPYSEAGVGTFIFSGGNAIAVLTTAHDIIQQN